VASSAGTDTTRPLQSKGPSQQQDQRFDAAYYKRYYGASPVHTRRQIAQLASGVSGLIGWWGLPLRSVLDVGAGPGYWRDWFAQHRPTVRYKSIDISAHACKKFGHDQADIASWSPAAPFDLVVCQGVLQYLDANGAASAIENLARACRGVLFLEVPTSTDRLGVLDSARSDLDIHFRSGTWYRRRLGSHFREVGAALHARHGAPIAFYELEASMPTVPVSMPPVPVSRVPISKVPPARQ
jgi:SAM-dependent methyltransferase